MHPRQLYTAASKYRLQSSVLLVALIYFSVGGSVFAAEEVAPSPPQLVSPAEGALTTGNTDPPVGVPTLRWKASSGATRYHVQISSSAGFASPADESNTTALAYTPRVALADGTYYWRVRAGTMLEWGSYSQSRSFVKDWGASGTLQPTLLAPDAGAVRNAFVSDDFSWTAVAGAARYLFEIDDNPFFASVDYSASALANTHTPTSKLGNNTYYWRVTPVDRQGHYGTTSEVRSFTFSWSESPTLLSPVHNAVLTFVPNLEWTAVASAKQYNVEISTAPDFSSGLLSYNTRNTRYAPPEGLANDQEYYWRIYAVDAVGNSGPHSEVRRFQMRWHLAPQLLWPMDNWTGVPHPVFAWRPVPAAEKYEIWIDESPQFATPTKKEIYTPWYTQSGNWDIGPIAYYWKVRGLDARGNTTPWSVTRTFSFGFPPYTYAPNPIFPTPYYLPQPDLTPVYTDPTVGFPLFLWDTVHDYSVGADLPFPSADYYRLEVDDNPSFTSLNFVIETSGLGAAPTVAHPFNDLTTGLYYWRVKAFLDGVQLGPPSVQLTRIDPRRPGRPFKSDITLVYPADGHEVVVDPPILGWYPITGTTKYRVQIATDSNFTELVDEAQPTSFHYMPFQGRQQRPASSTYYWRVRSEQPQNGWSEVRHFNLSQRLLTSNPWDYDLPTPISDDSANLVASGPNEGMGVYELTRLYVAQDRNQWLGLFWVVDLVGLSDVAGSVRYALYLDADHVVDSGATSDPLGNSIVVAPIHQPEAVIYIDRTADNLIISAQIWKWDASLGIWGPALSLPDLGGSAAVFPEKGVVEVYFPHNAVPGIGADDWSGSLALQAFTIATSGGGGIRDTMPDETVPLTHFAFTSDLLNPIYPFDTPLESPMTYNSLPPIRWLMPYWDSVDGYQVEVARDSAFTDIVRTWESYENSLNPSPYYAPLPTTFVPTVAFEDNETYYWRVRVRHEFYWITPVQKRDRFDYGPWSKPFRFRLESYVPTNLTTSAPSPLPWAPTFQWDRVENAGAYHLQVDDDANFSSPILIDRDVVATSYTPGEVWPYEKILSDGNYFWRLRIRRGKKTLLNSVYGPWTPTLSFSRLSPYPQPLSPINDVVVDGLPTFRWQAVLTPTVEPRLATPLYKVLVDDDPNFGSPLSLVTDATTYTPIYRQLSPQKFPDGTWYWKVAILDTTNNTGPFSPTQRFYKEYQAPDLVSPSLGAKVAEVPTFVWQPVAGAAYYRLEYASDASFSFPTAVTTDNTSYTPVTAISYDNVFWRVQMFDLDRVAGPFEVGRLSIGFKVFLPMARHGVQ